MFASPPSPDSLPDSGMMKSFSYANVQYASLTQNLRPGRRALHIIFKLLAVTLCLAILSITSFHLYGIQRGQHSEPATLNAEPGEASLGRVRGPGIKIPKIPSTFKTVGLIFYGRRSRAEILDCYLKVSSSQLELETTDSKSDSSFSAQSGREWWSVGRSAFRRQDERCRGSQMARSTGRYFTQLHKG